MSFLVLNVKMKKKKKVAWQFHTTFNSYLCSAKRCHVKHVWISHLSQCGSVFERSLQNGCNKKKKRLHIEKVLYFKGKNDALTLSDSHLLQDISQSLHIILVVLLTVLPGCEALILFVYVHVPHMHKVGRPHHPHLAAGLGEGPQALSNLWLLPIKKARAEYAQPELFALLEDACHLGGTRDAGTGRHVPCDFILLWCVWKNLEQNRQGCVCFSYFFEKKKPNE